jgi:hypothetical protein
MTKIAEIALIIALALLMALVVLLSGCTSNSNQQQDAFAAGNGSNPPGAPPFDANFRGGNRSNFGNLTSEQRQQMMEEMAQQAISACKGKSEGDACAMNSPRGNTTGTCTTRNETLSCGFGNMGGQGTRQPIPQ